MFLSSDADSFLEIHCSMYLAEAYKNVGNHEVENNDYHIHSNFYFLVWITLLYNLITLFSISDFQNICL